MVLIIEFTFETFEYGEDFVKPVFYKQLTGIYGAPTAPADQNHGLGAAAGIYRPAEHQLAHSGDKMRIDRLLGFIHPRDMHGGAGVADE
jgi:hypothetical protein